jgi:hypothetical protein
MRGEAQLPARLCAILGDPAERAFDLCRKRWIDKFDSVEIAQDDLPQAAIGQHADTGAGIGAAIRIAHGVVAGMDQPARDRLIAADTDVRSLQRVQQIGDRSERRRVERHVGKTLRQRLAAGQGDLAGAAVAVVDDEALQHVVDLVERNVERERGIAIDRRLVFEVTDPAARQHHSFQSEVGGTGRCGGHEQENECQRKIAQQSHRRGPSFEVLATLADKHGEFPADFRPRGGPIRAGWRQLGCRPQSSRGRGATAARRRPPRRRTISRAAAPRRRSKTATGIAPRSSRR